MGGKQYIQMNLNKKKPTKLKNMTELVNQTDIASIKNIASGIIKVINDSNSTAKDLEAIIKLDPPLSARILKVANSAYYSQQKISNIEGAIIRIGFNTLKYIALGQKVRNIFSKDEKINGYSRASLWRHSVAVGLLGKLIFDKKFGSGGNNIYAAGLPLR